MTATSGFDRRSASQRQSDDPVARYLGEFQTEVMGVFWPREGATVREALEAINKRRRRHKLAYTTVLTVIRRLWQRGLLEREAEGRRFRYHSTGTRDDLLGELSDELIDRLFDDFGDIAVAQMETRLERLDPARLNKLAASRSR